MNDVQSYEERYAAAWQASLKPAKRRDIPLESDRKIEILRLMDDGIERTRAQIMDELGVKRVVLYKHVINLMVRKKILAYRESGGDTWYRLASS